MKRKDSGHPLKRVQTWVFIILAPCEIELSAPLQFPGNQDLGPLSSGISPKVIRSFHLFIIPSPRFSALLEAKGKCPLLCVFYQPLTLLSVSGNCDSFSHQTMMIISFLVEL